MTLDPQAQWFHEHFAEAMERYAGQTVAIHATRGVVAHGTYTEVCNELERLGIPDTDVVLEYIRHRLAQLSPAKPDN